MSDSRQSAATSSGGAFPATRWSLVLEAHDPASPALGELCRRYWRPVYSFLRRQGNSPPDAEDLTQGFFASLLERGSLVRVTEGKGRLRSFLLVAVKRFAASQHERAQALKRGGLVQHVSLDLPEAEEHYALEPATHETPERVFERQWARVLLAEVMQKLRDAYASDGRGAVFDALRERLVADGEPTQLAEVAARLGMNEGAVKVALLRLRQRYASRLQEEIAKTVDSPAEVREEIVHLLQIFGPDG